METAMTSQISRIYHINIFTCQMFFKYRLIFVSYFFGYLEKFLLFCN